MSYESPGALHHSGANVSLAERMAALTVRATSPQRTVRVTLTGTGGVRVALRPGCLDGYTGSSLSAEVTDAVAAALRGHAQAVASLLEHCGVPHTPARGDRASVLDDIDVMVTSQGGGVVARWHQGVRVSIAGGAFRERGDEAAVSAEIEETVRALLNGTARVITRAMEATAPGRR